MEVSPSGLRGLPWAMVGISDSRTHQSCHSATSRPRFSLFGPFAHGEADPASLEHRPVQLAALCGLCVGGAGLLLPVI